MSIPETLTRRIRIVLQQSNESEMYREANSGNILSAEAIRDPDSYSPPYVVKVPGRYELVNPQIILLRRLYASCSIEEQRVFSSALQLEINQRNARIVAHLLVELKEFLTLRYWERFDTVARAFWLGVADKLAVEHWAFTGDNIDSVRVGVARIGSLCDSAIGQPDDAERWESAKLMRKALRVVSEIIDLVDYARLEAELTAESNPAVDSDRRVLLTRLQELGFSESLSLALHEIERRGGAAASSFDFKSVMELLRTFYEEFVEEAARRIEPLIGRPARSPGKRVSATLAVSRTICTAQASLGLMRSSFCKSCTTTCRIKRAISSGALQSNSGLARSL